MLKRGAHESSTLLQLDQCQQDIAQLISVPFAANPHYCWSSECYCDDGDNAYTPLQRLSDCKRLAGSTEGKAVVVVRNEYQAASNRVKGVVNPGVDMTLTGVNGRYTEMCDQEG